jgi:hypothetical protein
MPENNERLPRAMRNPSAPRVIRLEELLEGEIMHGNCSRTMASGLLLGFLEFELDFQVDCKGQLSWWVICDEDYQALLGRNLIDPDE